MFETVDVLGARISNATTDEVADCILSRIREQKNTVVYTPNSEIIEQFRKEETLLKLLNSADILTADGIGVVYGAKILGTPLKGRAAGYDIACKLLEAGAKEGLRFFLFGSREEVCHLAKENLEKNTPAFRLWALRTDFSKNRSGKQLQSPTLTWCLCVWVQKNRSNGFLKTSIYSRELRCWELVAVWTCLPVW